MACKGLAARQHCPRKCSPNKRYNHEGVCFMKRMQGAWILGAAMAFTVFPSQGKAQQASEPAASDSAPQKNIQLVGARATLSKTLDAKKLKQGDPVMAKLQDDVKGSDASSQLPKNTVLVGHVDQVQPSENKGDSSVQVTFDK